MQLTPHFTLQEFTDSPTAIRRAINNTPGDTAIANLKRVAEVLEQVRALFGKPLVISSGYRSPALNASVGGARTSAHLYGLAADFIVPGVTPAETAKAIVRAGIEFDQLIYEGTWVHIGLSAGKPRNEVLTAHFGNGPVTYTRGIA